MDVKKPMALHVNMLGPWKLQVAGKSVPNSAWKSKKALSVFRYLLAFREHKVHKDTLLNLFWPDDNPEDATRSLHTTIYFLRRMIQPARGAYQGTSYVRYSNGMYWLEVSDSSWFDVDAFLDHYVKGRACETTDPDRALDHYKQAIHLYHGDFLAEEAFEDWVEPFRNELRDTFISLSLRASQLFNKRPEGVSEAVRICRAALAKDPFREDLHQAIMVQLIRAGRHGEAAAQYRQLTALLEEEFDLPPSPETRALFQSMQMAVVEDNSTLTAAALDDVEERPFVCDSKVFDAVYSVALRAQKRHRLPIGLITVSVDDNHTTSKQMADMLDVLQQLVRQSDVISQHHGGFRVLLHHTGQLGCKIVARRVIRALTRDDLPIVRVHSRSFEGGEDRA